MTVQKKRYLKSYINYPRKGFISIAVLIYSKTIHPQKLRLLQFQSHHVSSVISSAWVVERPVTAPLHHRPTVPNPTTRHILTCNTRFKTISGHVLFASTTQPRVAGPFPRIHVLPRPEEPTLTWSFPPYQRIATQKPSATTTACFCQQSPAARRSSYPQVSLHVRSTKLFIHTTCAIPNLLLHTKWICILPTTHRGMCFCIIAPLLTHDITCAISLSDHVVPTCSVLNLSTALSTASTC